MSLREHLETQKAMKLVTTFGAFNMDQYNMMTGNNIRIYQTSQVAVVNRLKILDLAVQGNE